MKGKYFGFGIPSVSKIPITFYSGGGSFCPTLFTFVPVPPESQPVLLRAFGAQEIQVAYVVEWEEGTTITDPLSVHIVTILGSHKSPLRNPANRSNCK